jgi:hypothetical protein
MGKADLRVDWATHEAAKYACENWHYSGCLPGAKKCVFIGAWEDQKFIGTVIFSPGATSNLGAPYGLNQITCTELVRIALKEHSSFVSQIVSKAFKFLKKRSPGIRLVVSFADPHAGHAGGIYQAGNWVYTGTSSETSVFQAPDGRIIHPRSLGASDFKKGLKKLPPAGSQKIKLPGKHRYLMPLDDEMRKRILPLSKPYPKRAKQAMASDQEEQRQCSTDPHAPIPTGLT